MERIASYTADVIVTAWKVTQNSSEAWSDTHLVSCWSSRFFSWHFATWKTQFIKSHSVNVSCMKLIDRANVLCERIVPYRKTWATSSTVKCWTVIHDIQVLTLCVCVCVCVIWLFYCFFMTQHKNFYYVEPQVAVVLKKNKWHDTI